jgi:hypothetical protein
MMMSFSEFDGYLCSCMFICQKCSLIADLIYGGNFGGYVNKYINSRIRQGFQSSIIRVAEIMHKM